LAKMIKNCYSELNFEESDLVDLLMSTGSIPDGLITKNVTINKEFLDSVPSFTNPTSETINVEEFDKQQQNNWYMPDEYKTIDIAEYLLSLCNTDAELQRVGKELLLFQEKNLFNLLRYLKYLVDIMKQHGIIWGVGRGSSVASYVLYLLEVHRVDSMYYDLDPEEFLR
jgi:DNA polymerase III alpha subunit